MLKILTTTLLMLVSNVTIPSNGYLYSFNGGQYADTNEQTYEIIFKGSCDEYFKYQTYLVISLNDRDNTITSQLLGYSVTPTSYTFHVTMAHTDTMLFYLYQPGHSLSSAPFNYYYDISFSYEIVNDYANGYDTGLAQGYNTGYDTGFERGVTEGLGRNGTFNWITNVFKTCESVLDIEILPNIKLMYLLGIALLLPLLYFILSWFKN